MIIEIIGIGFIIFCVIGLLFGLYQQIQIWRGKPYRKCLFPICEEADGYIYPEKQSISESLDSMSKDKCPEYCVRSNCSGCEIYETQIKDLFTEKSKSPTTLEEEINIVSQRYPEVSFAKLSRIAKHVSEWQKKQDEKEKLFLEGVRQSYDNTIQHLEEKMKERYEQGKKDLKEQMMKETIEGVVQDNGEFINFGDGKYIDLDPTQQLNPVFKLKDGQKVKLLLITEDD